MKNNMSLRQIILILTIAILLITSTYGLCKKATYATGVASLATWGVTLNQTGVNSSLTILPNSTPDTYTLNIVSTSDVDIKYSIVVSNLPTGVRVALGEGTPVAQDANHKVTFANAGTILYSAQTKTKSHTLTFSADAGTTPVSNQNISIDVIVEQIV